MEKEKLKTTKCNSKESQGKTHTLKNEVNISYIGDELIISIKKEKGIAFNMFLMFINYFAFLKIRYSDPEWQKNYEYRINKLRSMAIAVSKEQMKEINRSESQGEEYLDEQISNKVKELNNWIIKHSQSLQSGHVE